MASGKAKANRRALHGITRGVESKYRDRSCRMAISSMNKNGNAEAEAAGNREIPGLESADQQRDKIKERNEKKHQKDKQRRLEQMSETVSSCLMAWKLERTMAERSRYEYYDVESTYYDGSDYEVDISEEVARIIELESQFPRNDIYRSVIACGGDLNAAVGQLRKQQAAAAQARTCPTLLEILEKLHGTAASLEVPAYIEQQQQQQQKSVVLYASTTSGYVAGVKAKPYQPPMTAYTAEWSHQANANIAAPKRNAPAAASYLMLSGSSHGGDGDAYSFASATSTSLLQQQSLSSPFASFGVDWATR